MSEENVQDKVETEAPETGGTSVTETSGTSDEPKEAKGFLRRINKLTAEKYQLLDRLKQLEEDKKPKPVEKPSRDSFESDEDYQEAFSSYAVDQAINKVEAKKREASVQAERESNERAYNERVEKFLDDQPDFSKVVSQTDIPLNQTMIDTIFGSDVGPQLTWHLVNNLDQAEKIASLDPVKTARELTRLEVQIQSKPNTVTKAPEPISEVGGAEGQPEPELSEKLPIDEWMRRRNKQRGR